MAVNFDEVPPPTRGWSRGENCHGFGAGGSPAHAGMVPLMRCQRICKRRFPRPRGDGPDKGTTRDGIVAVPPPTRGWSPRDHDGGALGGGSPAHAGMVPSSSFFPAGGSGFPRPRGDGPADERISLRQAMVPPPTRGWSQHRARHCLRRRGSPAHAGMVPSVTREIPSTARFPRPRGDGPAGGFRGLGQCLVPPPTRGWSLRLLVYHIAPSGSPAHAGMVPGRAARDTAG